MQCTVREAAPGGSSDDKTKLHRAVDENVHSDRFMPTV
jgi:hypothetical protein